VSRKWSEDKISDLPKIAGLPVPEPARALELLIRIRIRSFGIPGERSPGIPIFRGVDCVTLSFYPSKLSPLSASFKSDSS
jgi:hypothetical protein